MLMRKDRKTTAQKKHALRMAIGILTASSCLFVDDFPPNIEAAENAGMQGIVFHAAGQLREELKARGIL